MLFIGENTLQFVFPENMDSNGDFTGITFSNGSTILTVENGPMIFDVGTEGKPSPGDSVTFTSDTLGFSSVADDLPPCGQTIEITAP